MEVNIFHHDLYKNHNNSDLKDRIITFTTLIDVVWGIIRSLASTLLIKPELPYRALRAPGVILNFIS